MAMWRTFSALIVIQAAFAAGITWAIAWADQAYPPPLDKAAVASREVLDGDGALLRAFTTKDSKWRLAVKAADVDPQFIKMLVAYEDQRFAEHRGIDLWAIGRAGWQIATHGRIVSGVMGGGVFGVVVAGGPVYALGFLDRLLVCKRGWRSVGFAGGHDPSLNTAAASGNRFRRRSARDPRGVSRVCAAA